MRTGAFQNDAQRAERTLNSMKDEAVKAGKAVGAAFLGFAAAGALLVKESIDAFDATFKLSQSLGLTVESLSALGYAAEASGLSQDELGASLNKLSKTAADAALGGNAQAAAFAAIGVAAKGADGVLKNTDVLLSEIADKFSTYADGAAKTALAQNIFGESGAKLLPLLNAGAEGIKELADEAEMLGLVMGTDAVQAAETFNDNLALVQNVVKGLTNRIAQQLLPTLESLSTKLLDSAKNSGVLDEAARAASTGIKILLSAGVIVGAAFKTIGEGLGGLAAQLVALFSGRFQDAMNIGLNTTMDFVGNILGAANTVGNIWDEATSKIAGAAGEKSTKIAAPIIQAGSKIKTAGKEIKDETKKIFDDIEKQIANINRTIQTFGQSETQIALFDLKNAGANADQLERAAAALQTIETLKAAQEERDKAADKLKGFESAGRTSFESTRSPIEQLNIELGKQMEILDALGPAYQDTFFRAVEAAQAAYDETVKVSDEMDEFSKRATEAIQGSIGEGLTAILSGNFKDIGSNFKKTIDRMVADAAAAQLSRYLLGDSKTGQGGFLSTAISAVGSFFGGAKAGGGDVMSGRSYLVGEQGPEMFVPRTLGAIVPNNAAGGGGSTTNINVNVAMPQGATRATGLQFGTDAARQISRANARNG